MFLDISQNSQENTCTRDSFLITLQALKKSFWHRCFPVNSAKFLRKPFSQNTSGRLLLISHYSNQPINPFVLNVYPFFSPWKHQKTVRFSGIFRGWRKVALGTNELINQATKGERSLVLKLQPSTKYLTKCKKIK